MCENAYLRHAIASMANLLVTDWSLKIEVAANKLICPHGKATVVVPEK